MAKFDSSGNLSWSRTWGGLGHEYIVSIIQDYDGGFVIAGETESFGAGDSDALLAKFDSSGNLSWSRTWGGMNSENAVSIIKSADGGYALTGGTDSYGAGVDDVFLIKYNSNGTINNCADTICQSPLATTTSPIVTVRNINASVINPSATISSPSAMITSPTATNTVIIAPM